VSSYVVIDKEKCVDDDECVVKVKEADESELIGKRVSSMDIVFEVYNEYAFHKDFSIRCDKLWRREGSGGSFVTANKVLKGIPRKKIRHLQNGPGSAIVKLGLFFILNLLGNGSVRSMT